MTSPMMYLHAVKWTQSTMLYEMNCKFQTRMTKILVQQHLHIQILFYWHRNKIGCTKLATFLVVLDRKPEPEWTISLRFIELALQKTGWNACPKLLLSYQNNLQSSAINVRHYWHTFVRHTFWYNVMCY